MPIRPRPALPCGAGRSPKFVTGSAVPWLRRLAQIGVVDDEARSPRLARGLVQGQRLVSARRRDVALGRLHHPGRLADRRGDSAWQQRNRLNELSADWTVATPPGRRRAQARLRQPPWRPGAPPRHRMRQCAMRHSRPATRRTPAAEQRDQLTRDAAAQSARLAALVEQAERLAADLAEQVARSPRAGELRQIPDPTAARERAGAGPQPTLAAARTSSPNCRPTVTACAREADGSASSGCEPDPATRSQSWKHARRGSRRQLEILAARAATRSRRRSRAWPRRPAADRAAAQRAAQPAAATPSRRAATAADALAEAENAPDRSRARA